MFDHLSPHQTALPPPTSARAARDRNRPRSERAPLATTVVATVVLAALVIVFALGVIATMPASVVGPTAFLLIGGLIAGSLALRTRAALTRRAVTSRHSRRTRRDPTMKASW